jgi:hypothetical protein
MSTAPEIRRKNARFLAERIGPTAFGQIAGMTQAQANNIIGPNPIRNIGHTMARRIEVAFKKPTGWLDVDHTRSIEAAIERLSSLTPPYDGERDAQVWQDAMSAAIGVLCEMQN